MRIKTVFYAMCLSVSLAACDSKARLSPEILVSQKANDQEIYKSDNITEDLDVSTDMQLAEIRDDNEYIDPLAVGRDEYSISYFESDEPMAICNLFPDHVFAYRVACLFDKHPMDVVTFEELSEYCGSLEFGPGELENVEGIGYLTGLTAFSNCKNNLCELPPEIGNLKNLKSIDLLKSYNFQTLPKEIGLLESLEVLHVDLTQLSELPPEIGNLGNLKELYADNSQITYIPKEIGNLINLEFLDLHSNNIDTVPDSIVKLVNLKELNLSYTNIKYLPEDIGNLTALERVNFFNCELKKLPQSTRNLKNIIYFNVYDNYELDEDYKTYIPEDVYRCRN